MPRWVLLYVSFFGVAALAACGGSHATAPRAGATAGPLESASVGRGRTVFAAQCATCHGASGEGGQIGPPLRGEHRRRSAAYIADAIADPSPPMPKLAPAQMSAQDLVDVTAFVQQL